MKVVVAGSWAPSLLKFRGPLLAAMVARGHDVLAIAPDGNEAVKSALDAIGVQFRELKLRRAGLDPLADLQTIVSLVRLLREVRADAVFAYTIKPALYATLAARLAGVRRRAVMITGLGYTFASGAGPKQQLAKQVAVQMFRRILTSRETVFFQNPDDLQEFRDRNLLPTGARIELVRGSGVDLSHYTPSPLPPGPVRFLFVGRLLRSKGIYEYVEAARRVRKVLGPIDFDVVGWRDVNPESVSEGELAEWVREGVIRYHGSVEDVRPYLAQAHVLVLPSYREGTPRSVLEAMAMGRAIITTDVPGCRETVVSNTSGILVPARDPEALAREMAELVGDRERLGRLATAGQERATLLYDARVVAARMLDVMDL